MFCTFIKKTIKTFIAMSWIVLCKLLYMWISQMCIKIADREFNHIGSIIHDGFIYVPCWIDLKNTVPIQTLIK